jgi:integrase
MALATQNSTLKIVQVFFRWLAFQRGYKKKIHVPDVEYLNLSTNDARAAKSSAPVDFPSMEQMRHVIAQMPHQTEIEMRDRAIVAFTILTAARVGAIVSLKIKDFDQSKLLISQNPNHVNTKFSKRIETYLMVIDETTLQIFLGWVEFLKTEKLFSPNSPLFPKTQNGQDENNCFKANGLSQEHWAGTTAIRDIFKKAFNNAGVKYYHPHSLRHTLTHQYQAICKTPEEFKAISQNLGHENVLTTLVSYGEVSTHRQGEIVKGVAKKQSNIDYGLLAAEVYKLYNKPI